MVTYSGLLIFIAVVWGLGFVETKRLFAHFTPLEITCLRFSVAALVSTPIFIRCRTWSMSRAQLGRAFLLAMLLFAGMYVQAWGLLYTTASKSGFITSLYIVFVPLIELIFFKKKISNIFWLALIVALLGVACMSGGHFDGVNGGDILTLLSALIFSLQILYLSHVASSYPDSMELNGLQCLFIALVSFVFLLFIGVMPKLEDLSSLGNHFFSSPLYSVLFLGIFPSFLALAVQVYCQKKVAAHLASLAFLLESPFAAFFGVLILGERLNVIEVSGCVLITAAIVVVPLSMMRPQS
ncbi:MAG: DMT family transporter [Bdellovibrio sp.]|nr:DMT family transporter [Bdellovibrio sp.]